MKNGSNEKKMKKVIRAELNNLLRHFKVIKVSKLSQSIYIQNA